MNAAAIRDRIATAPAEREEETLVIGVFVLARYDGSPVYTLDLSSRRGAHLQTGGQVDYRGSLLEVRGPAAVLGQCACSVCMPSEERMRALEEAGWADDDGSELFGRFRLVLTTAGGETLRCVRPESVTARPVRFRVVETGWRGGISYGWEIRDHGPGGLGVAYTVWGSFPGGRSGRADALAECAALNEAEQLTPTL